MTRSIFDPGGGETEQSGSTFLAPEAQNASHVPPDVVDGEVEAEDAEAPVARDDEDAARRLGEMTSPPGDVADQAGS